LRYYVANATGGKCLKDRAEIADRRADRPSRTAQFYWQKPVAARNPTAVGKLLFSAALR
jgi:hypothetical protein